MRLARALLIALLLCLAPVGALAGPVHLETPHFVFTHNGKAANLAGKLAEIAEGRRRYIRHLVGLPPTGNERIEVKIAVNDDEMQGMTGAGGRVDDWVSGITFAGDNLIVMSARGNEFFKASDTFVHELAHYYLDEAVGNHDVPRWFHEGFAMLASSELMGDRMESLLAAVATNSMIPISDLADSFPSRPPAVHLAYAQSMFFVRYLQRVSNDSGVHEVIGKMQAGMPFDAAFLSVWGRPPEALFSDFKRTFSRVDSVLALVTSATILWVVVVGIFVFVYLRKKKMAAEKVRIWELEDELQAERIRRVLEDREPSLTNEPVPPASDGPGPPPAGGAGVHSSRTSDPSMIKGPDEIQ